MTSKIVADAFHKTTSEFKAQVMELSGEKIKRETLRRVSTDKFKLQVELSFEGYKNLEKIKGIKRKHDYSEIVEQALEIYLRKVSPEQMKGNSLKSKVWKKAKGQCSTYGADFMAGHLQH